VIVPVGARAVEATPKAAVPDGVTLRTEVFEVEQVLDAAGRVERRLVPALDLVAGDELRYAIRLRNESGARIDAGRIQVQTDVPPATRFLPGSAGGAGALVEYALPGGTFSANLPELSDGPPIGASPAASEVGPGDVVPTGADLPVAVPDVDSDSRTGAEPVVAPGPTAEDPAGGDATAGQGAASDAAADPGSPGAVTAVGPEPDAPELIIRWTYQKSLEPAAEAELFFHVRLD
jgi:hypothetical protein